MYLGHQPIIEVMYRNCLTRYDISLSDTQTMHRKRVSASLNSHSLTHACKLQYTCIHQTSGKPEEID